MPDSKLDKVIFYENTSARSALREMVYTASVSDVLTELADLCHEHAQHYTLDDPTHWRMMAKHLSELAAALAAK